MAQKTLTFTFHYWGAFCQGPFPKAFVLDQSMLYKLYSLILIIEKHFFCKFTYLITLSQTIIHFKIFNKPLEYYNMIFKQSS
jgi:hypothetical protein